MPLQLRLLFVVAPKAFAHEVILTELAETIIGHVPLGKIDFVGS